MSRRIKFELTVSREPSAKNRGFLGVLFSILVLLLISTAIVASIVIMSPELAGQSAQQLPSGSRGAITLEEALLGELGANDFAGHWLSPLTPADQADALLLEDSKALSVLELEQPPSSRPLLGNASQLTLNEAQGFKLSPSRRYLLIWNSKRRQFRHTFTARYFVYDTKLNVIAKISTHQATGPPGDQGQPASAAVSNAYVEASDAVIAPATPMHTLDHTHQADRFQLAEWTANDGILLVQANDIYLLADVTGVGQGGRHLELPRRLTYTGKPGELFNGVPDWLYEEEILGQAPALESSPAANSLAYLSFNDSNVDLVPFSVYGELTQLLPTTKFIRYPRAGRPNPTVQIRLIENIGKLTSAKPIKDLKLRLPDELLAQQHYIFRLKWLSEDKLALVWLNRAQNSSAVLVCSRLNDWSCLESFRTSAPGGWIDMAVDEPIWPLNERFYLTLAPKQEGADVGSFKHIAKVELGTSSADMNSTSVNRHQFITAGRREVTAINGIDKRRSLVYYTSTLEGEPGQRHLFVASLDSNAKGDLCITCGHRPNECLYNYARLSPSASHYIFECAGPGVPRIELRSVEPAVARLRAEHSSGASASSPDDSGLVWLIDDNAALREKLTRRKAMPSQARLTVPIEGTNYTAQVLLLLPPPLGPGISLRATPSPLRPRRHASADPSPASAHNQPPVYTRDTIQHYTELLGTSGQSLPMVVDVYGGPGSQKVDYQYHIHFGHYLATSRRVVYALIDGRGSGLQGTRRLFELYGRLGSVEIDDQLMVAKQLAKEFTFIDQQRMAIWGWSYGGYAAGMALARSGARYPDTVFQCAASVAPVTSWHYYDTAYTERYMASPYLHETYLNGTEDDTFLANNSSQLNERYRRASLLEQVANFGRKKYLLVHGTADDNVHFQQSIMLMKQLIRNNILFDTRLYPDQDHAIANKADKLHLGATLSDFFDECLAIGA